MIRIDGIELATYSSRTLVDPIDLKKAFDSVEPNHQKFGKNFFRIFDSTRYFGSL